MKISNIQEFNDLIATSEICRFNPSGYEEFLKELEQDCKLSLVTHEKESIYTNVSNEYLDSLGWIKIRKNNHERSPKTADEILKMINEIEKKQINKCKFNY